MLIRQILVPLDGTMRAHMALPHAAALARPTASRLVLLHVSPPIDPSLASGASRAAAALQPHGQRLSLLHNYLEAAAEDLRDEGFSVHTEMLVGEPASAILSRAENDPGVDMVVMTTRGSHGSHGSSDLERLLTSSVADKVLQASPVPMLLVHSDEGMNSLKHFYKRAYHTILVPLDGSRFAEQALEQAQLLAGARGASLLLLSVAPDHYPGQGGSEPLDRQWIDGPEAASVDWRRSYLSERAESLAASGVLVRIQVAYGDPTEEIIWHAGQANADLIVMSTRGRSSMLRPWPGSVARKVAQQAMLPVLVVRSQLTRPHEQSDAGSAATRDKAVAYRAAVRI